MKYLFKLLNKYLFLKDWFNVVIWISVLWVATIALTWVFGVSNVASLSMTYILKTLSALSSFTILLGGSWAIFKMLFGVFSCYFEDPDGAKGEDSLFIKDMKMIYNVQKPNYECYLRPIFYLFPYFVFLFAAILLLSIQY